MYSLGLYDWAVFLATVKYPELNFNNRCSFLFPDFARRQRIYFGKFDWLRYFNYPNSKIDTAKIINIAAT